MDKANIITRINDLEAEILWLTKKIENYTSSELSQKSSLVHIIKDEIQEKQKEIDCLNNNLKEIKLKDNTHLKSAKELIDEAQDDDFSTYGRMGKINNGKVREYMKLQVQNNLDSIFCPKCGHKFQIEYSESGKTTGGISGAAAGALLGGKIGLALGPLGAISGTVPGAILGGIFGKDLGNFFDKAVCPKCNNNFNLPK